MSESGAEEGKVEWETGGGSKQENQCFSATQFLVDSENPLPDTVMSQNLLLTFTSESVAEVSYFA